MWTLSSVVSDVILKPFGAQTTGMMSRIDILPQQGPA
jgi:hypothetical protein